MMKLVVQYSVADDIDLAGKHILILWDIENIPIFPPVITLPVQVLRISEYFKQLGGGEVIIKTVVNPKTLLDFQNYGE